MILEQTNLTLNGVIDLFKTSMKEGFLKVTPISDGARVEVR